MKTLSEQDREFLVRIMEDSSIHLELDEIAHRHAATDEVRTVAGELFHSHKRMNEEIRELGERKGVGMPGQLTPGGKDVLLELTRRSGEQFDQFYLERIMAYSASEIDLLREEAEEGQDGDFRDFARNRLPSVEDGLRIVRNLVTAGIE